MHNGASEESKEVIFEVTPGLGMNIVAQLLEEKNLVKNAWIFGRSSRIFNRM